MKLKVADKSFTILPFIESQTVREFVMTVQAEVENGICSILDSGKPIE